MNTLKIGDIHYKNNSSKHPELSQIIGEPTTASLITLPAKIRDITSSVQISLRGGAHGHLGLVCTPNIYQTLVPEVEPYIHPDNPGHLVLAEVGLIQLSHYTSSGRA